MHDPYTPWPYAACLTQPPCQWQGSGLGPTELTNAAYYTAVRPDLKHMACWKPVNDDLMQRLLQRLSCMLFRGVLELSWLKLVEFLQLVSQALASSLTRMVHQPVLQC